MRASPKWRQRDKHMTKFPSPKNSNNKRMVNRKEATPNPQSPKRDKIFSQSRDIREDRATRQIKTTRIS
jgi:hypothetical protein